MAVDKIGHGLRILLSLAVFLHCVVARPGIVEDLESQIVPASNSTTANTTTPTPPPSTSSLPKTEPGNVNITGLTIGNGTKNGTVCFCSDVT